MTAVNVVGDHHCPCEGSGSGSKSRLTVNRRKQATGMHMRGKAETDEKKREGQEKRRGKEGGKGGTTHTVVNA